MDSNTATVLFIGAIFGASVAYIFGYKHGKRTQKKLDALETKLDTSDMSEYYKEKIEWWQEQCKWWQERATWWAEQAIFMKKLNEIAFKYLGREDM